MKSIKKEVVSSLIINKSEFINYLFPVNSVKDAKQFMEQLREKYDDANHHCSAYIIGKNQEIQKYSDDGEPSKTAGLPMIEVLKKQDLTNILAVTIRYFGGIKLGAGGLVRAYTKSVSESIKLATFTTLITFVRFTITIPFDEIGHVEKFLRDSVELEDTRYDELVHYTVVSPQSIESHIVDSINEKTKGKAVIKEIDVFALYQ